MRNPFQHIRIDTPNKSDFVFLPWWLSSKAIVLYFVVLVIASGIFRHYMLPWHYMFAGVGSILVFFYIGNILSKRWAVIRSPKRFEKRLFWTSFGIRLSYTILIYVIFQLNYGDAFGFENKDAVFYDETAVSLATFFGEGNFNIIEIHDKYFSSVDFSDMGYGIYLGFVYYFTGNSIIVSRIIKCLMSAFTAVLVYRLANRNFGEQTARLAGVLCMLWPNFWYYCGTSLKETEMVFLTVLFVEQADQMLRSRKFTAWKMVPLLFIIGALFFIRVPLAIIAVMALLFTITLSSSRVVSWAKKLVIGALAVSLIGLTMGNRIQEEAQQMYETVSSGQQQRNMEWRSRRENGNSFAKYAGAAVFAPLIFTIPFPTMVDTPYQDVQKIVNGGNFVKNVLSGILIFALFTLLLSGKWREHMLPLSLMLGYIVVLIMSAFAQSERFHQPAMPFEMMFVAYGISIIGNNKRHQRYYIYWLAFVFVACIGWQWFKLRGRGM